jgi:type IVB pilus formation R64 PilN family outer membrane protein
MRFKKTAVAMSLLLSVALSGCSSTHTPKWNEIDQDTNDGANEILSLKEDIIPKDNRFTEVINGFYIDESPIQIVRNSRNDLPVDFYKHIEMYEEEPIILNQFSTNVFISTGMKTEFINNTNSSTEDTQSITEETEEVAPILDFNDQLGGLGALGGGVNTVIEEVNLATPEEENTITIDYSGDLKGLFDQVSVKKNLKWKYDSVSNKVYFYKYETETFVLFGLSEEIETASSVTTNSSTESDGEDQGGSTTKNEQTIKFKSEQKYWTEVQETVSSMISGDGRVSFNKTQGKITIIDNDYTLSTVRKYVSDLNYETNKQVTLEIKIVNLKITDERNLGINLTHLNDSIGSSISESLTLGLGNAANSVSNSNNTLKWMNSTGNETLAINALDSYGTVKIDTSFSTMTMNNMPVPIQVTKNQSYISDVQVQEGSTDGGTPLQETKTDTISGGITLMVTPKAVGQNINLNYSMNLSVIDDLAEAPGGSGIQLPLTSTKNFVQRVSIKNGQPTVIAAFEKTDSKNGSTHPLNKNLWFLGGSETFEKEKELLLIMITPYITVIK